MFTRGFLLLGVGTCFLVLACANDEGTSDEVAEHGTGTGGASAGPIACDPFLAPALSLGTIVGAGEDANGTLYVVDSPPDFRVFVSEGDDLVRQYVSGFASEGENDFIFDVLEHDPAFTLKLETDGPTRMGVLFGTPP